MTPDDRIAAFDPHAWSGETAGFFDLPVAEVAEIVARWRQR